MGKVIGFLTSLAGVLLVACGVLAAFGINIYFIYDLVVTIIEQAQADVINAKEVALAIVWFLCRGVVAGIVGVACFFGGIFTFGLGRAIAE